MDEALRTRLQKMTRQALHATKLSLVHPITGEDVSWEAPMPKSMQTIVDSLAKEMEKEH
jgi:23S rRNA pseudouridine1911/1915/1917 synthase